MIHLNWGNRETLKKIECVHADAKKFIVHHKLTPGKIYDVKNESDEFYFIIDNSNRMAGFRKDYFKEVKN
ncbi:DUF6501 family protein [Oceanobacillus profundus]|uniref:Uncharacterized protein n=1 Tax=Oceanobacillus profundus TaxID=372463 RepID=A0A417YG09_9BACI|nr:DUF6501 family protein [Oceanobacillus profundus]MBR3118525.1 hypothetical protein [Oceanobacillus sp.]PAE29811.1 hypothetical protein CHI07_07505 [Paenibacillus sp. 7884-2]MCM3396678.1 DUF6501 family protein [Oceanobacillus profundus]MDO6450772.1 DUF6501 family protein [Oceanobacillus profundus]RHW31635.1 hypothetical protein D1B32_13010 [Oceanobacillus profundus]